MGGAPVFGGRRSVGHRGHLEEGVSVVAIANINTIVAIVLVLDVACEGISGGGGDGGHDDDMNNILL
jgi:hypothetical protein